MKIEGRKKMGVPQVKIESEKILDLIEKILPADLVNDLKKAIRDKDQDKINSLWQTKVKQLYDAYQSKILNFNLNENEQAIWTHEITKGILKKEVVERWIITNLRALKFFPMTKERPKANMTAVGLAISDTVVMNQYRNSKGSRVGTFTGGGSGRGVAGVSVGMSDNISRPFGDLVFLLGGKEVLRFPNISDPNGVNKIIKALKKQI
jgi:hypothetical protein